MIENYAMVKLFCSPGVRGKMCVIKKGGALENKRIKVIKYDVARQK